jgi:hypothetical protein
MASIVERLQKDALDPNVSVSTLLRQVKLIAAKLKLETVEDWVEKELSGYGDSDIPEYRIVVGAPRAFNPFHGWIPILLEDAKMMKLISTREIGQKISELEDLLRGENNGLQIPFPPELINTLNAGAKIALGQMSLLVGRGAAIGIVDAVRNKVLDWAIELEKRGIKGKDLGFSQEEEKIAHHPSVTMNIGSIGSLVGNLGVGNRIQDSSVGNVSNQVRQLVDQTRKHIDELNTAGIDKNELKKILLKIDQHLQMQNEDPRGLRSLLVELKNVVVGASGNLVASGIIHLINQILGTGVPSA